MALKYAPRDSAVPSGTDSLLLVADPPVNWGAISGFSLRREAHSPISRRGEEKEERLSKSDRFRIPTNLNQKNWSLIQCPRNQSKPTLTPSSPAAALGVALLGGRWVVLFVLMLRRR